MNKIKDLIVELGGFWEHQNNIMRVRVFEMLKLDTIRKKKKKTLLVVVYTHGSSVFILSFLVSVSCYPCNLYTPPPKHTHTHTHTHTPPHPPQKVLILQWSVWSRLEHKNYIVSNKFKSWLCLCGILFCLAGGRIFKKGLTDNWFWSWSCLSFHPSIPSGQIWRQALRYR